MNTLTIIFLIAAGLVLLAFVWAISRPAGKDAAHSISGIGECEKRSLAYWPQVRQALSAQDLKYVKFRSPQHLSQLSRERRAVAFEYLRGLRSDFEQMMQLATAIAVLSPEVTAVHEWERLRLTASFWMQYRTVQLRLLCRASSAEGLHELTDTVSGLIVKLDEALRELGEQAALSLELKSAFDGSGLRSV